MNYEQRLEELDEALSLAARRRDDCGASTPEGAEFAAEVAKVARQILHLQRNLSELRAVSRDIDSVESQRDRQMRRTEERAREWMVCCAGFATVGGLILLVSLGLHATSATSYVVALLLLVIAAGAFMISSRARRQVIALETVAAQQIVHLDERRTTLVSANTNAAADPMVPGQRPESR